MQQERLVEGRRKYEYSRRLAQSFFSAVTGYWALIRPGWPTTLRRCCAKLVGPGAGEKPTEDGKEQDLKWMDSPWRLRF